MNTIDLNELIVDLSKHKYCKLIERHLRKNHNKYKTIHGYESLLSDHSSDALEIASNIFSHMGALGSIFKDKNDIKESFDKSAGYHLKGIIEEFKRVMLTRGYNNIDNELLFAVFNYITVRLSIDAEASVEFRNSIGIKKGWFG